MRKMVEPHPQVIDKALEAMRMADVVPVVRPIRGGTDGARLSFMGLPCPNLFTGGMNFHGKFEYASLTSMQGDARGNPTWHSSGRNNPRYPLPGACRRHAPGVRIAHPPADTGPETERRPIETRLSPMDQYGFLRVAAAMPHVYVADCRRNAERHIALAQQAAQRGVEIVVFPELSLTGYTCGDLFLQPTLLDAAEEALEQLLRGRASCR